MNCGRPLNAVRCYCFLVLLPLEISRFETRFARKPVFGEINLTLAQFANNGYS